jgi:hypothetical protein
MRRRIWCETVPLAELGSKAVMALLRRFEVGAIVAVWPETLAEAGDALRRLAGEGVPTAVWPMLGDAEGRWMGAANAGGFAAFAGRAMDALSPPELVLDLEPPIEQLRSGLGSAVVNAHVLPPGADPRAYASARAVLAALADEAHGRGMAVSAAIAPPALFGAWEERLGTPVSGVPWDHVSPMLYTSIIEGWSRGLLRRADALALAAAGCAEARARFGARGGASLGAVGTGAFGDEPTYRSPAELAEDVGAARAEGVDDLALFDLGGVLRRAPAEAWLEAFTTAPAKPAPPTLRSRATVAGLRATGGTWAAFSRLRARWAGGGA